MRVDRGILSPIGGIGLPFHRYISTYIEDKSIHSQTPRCCLMRAGAGIFGSLSDSFLGRKGVLQLVCIINAVVGFATAFSHTYLTYLALRLITGISSGGIGLSSFVLATELIGPSWRGIVAMSVFYFFSTGIMLLSGVAYVAPSLRYLYIFVSLPSFLYLCLILAFVSESPRWYIIRGRTDEAMKVLRLFAKRNGRLVPPGVELASEISNCQELLKPDEKTNHNPFALVISTSTDQSPKHAAIVKDSPASNDKPAPGTLLDVFRYAETRTRMMVMVMVWFRSANVYYGITLNVVNIGVNLSLSVFLNAAAEMPAFAITTILLKKLGRLIILVGSMLLSGGCCLMAVFLSSQLPNSSSLKGSITGSVGLGNGTTNSYMHFLLPTHQSSQRFQDNLKIGRQVCGMIAIFGMAASYNFIYLYTAELFPTVVRNAALGLASQASHVGAVTAPFVVVLGHINPSISFVIFALSAIPAGLLALKLPETLDRPLSDTLEGFKNEEMQQQIKNKGETHEK
ncbi:hypothetical protein O6H91_04G090000 [Diphasiastrum complanatum]|uniref:Uncharacterized protein n=1 Tax=Diphasiastrum complanatum TaxID=34168 RepID=A0ACC2DZ54_DIPCM|nr:hypothetical protein O6H91_04G090000 [Diphasiastrum complanatum]